MANQDTDAPLLGSSSADVLEWGTVPTGVLADPYHRAELFAQLGEQNQVASAVALRRSPCGTRRGTVGDKNLTGASSDWEDCWKATRGVSWTECKAGHAIDSWNVAAMVVMSCLASAGKSWDELTT